MKNLKNEDAWQARHSWVLENKQLLMSQISKTNVEAKGERKEKTFSENWRNFAHIYQSFVPHNINKAFRPVLTAMMALVITTGGWVASAYAQPGDFMWSTKVAFNSVVEQGKLAFTSDENKTSVQLEFASKRAQILRQVVDSDIENKDTKNKLIKETSEDLKHKLDNVSESLQQTDATTASGLVKELSLKTKEISNTLKDAAAQTAIEDEGLSKDLSLQATDTAKQSLELVEVVLEKKIEANLEISEDEKLIIREHIAESVLEIQKDTEKVQAQADKLTEETKVENNDSTQTTTSSANNIELLTIVTLSASTTAVTSTAKTGDSVTEIKSRAAELSKTIVTENNNVQVLLDSNVLEAVKKTLELKNTISTLSHEVDTTLSNYNLENKVLIENKTTTTTTIISTSSTVRGVVTSTTNIIKTP